MCILTLTLSVKAQPIYFFRNYVKVGRLMQTVKPPYIIDLQKGKKHLVFIGCDHNRDTTHPQFAAIGHYMNRLRPQIAFNEGGQFEQNIHYISVGQDILAQGESGSLKYWCDR